MRFDDGSQQNPSRRIEATGALDLLTALVTHGLAHHRLHHHVKRTVLTSFQRLAFKAGGFFVPGLGYGKYIGDPLAEVAMSAGQEPHADDRTIELLTSMGYTAQDFIRAIEFLVAHDYAERVGGITIREREFTNRLARLRTLHSSDPDPVATE